MNNISNDELNSALICLRAFKQAYKEEHGTITVGDIRDLVDKIDLIEECVKRQKNVPSVNEKQCERKPKTNYRNIVLDFLLFVLFGLILLVGYLISVSDLPDWFKFFLLK